MAKVLTTQAALRKADHRKPDLMFRCAKCQQAKPVQHEGGTGYAYGWQGKLKEKPVCYDCCAILERTTMDETGKATLYLVRRDDDWYVTNWPGTLSFRAAVRIGRHNIARKRYDAWFITGGRRWHGVTIGDNSQLCHCTRLKPRHSAK